MKIYYSLLFILLISCSSNNLRENESDEPFFKVSAQAETTPVDATPEDDAADDPAIWFNEKNPSESLIFGSDKTGGLDVYSLTGELVRRIPSSRINNIDLREIADFSLIGASNRDSVGMDFWKLQEDTLRIDYLGHIPSNLNSAYGFCMYRSPKSGSLFAFVNSKKGMVEQYRLDVSSDSISGELVRELQLPSQVEGMVADDSLSTLFVGVEEDGIYRFGAEPDHHSEGERIAQTGEENEAIKYDVEGLTIYYESGKDGYLLASSQGNNSYAVFERAAPHSYLGSFEIVDGKVDGAQETDGIDVSHRSFGPDFPKGIFVVQDGFNYEGEKKVAQNFKMVSWEMIEKGFKN